MQLGQLLEIIIIYIDFGLIIILILAKLISFLYQKLLLIIKIKNRSLNKLIE